MTTAQREKRKAVSEPLQVVSRLLGVLPEQVRDARTLTKGKDRFFFFTVTVAKGETIFIKATDLPDRREALKREANASRIAQQLGLPTIQLVSLPNGSLYAENNGVADAEQYSRSKTR